MHPFPRVGRGVSVAGEPHPEVLPAISSKWPGCISSMASSPKSGTLSIAMRSFVILAMTAGT